MKSKFGAIPYMVSVLQDTPIGYFCVLSDGGTDSSVVEEELVYLLYFKNGKPTVNLSIEPAENANTEGLY